MKNKNNSNIKVIAIFLLISMFFIGYNEYFNQFMIISNYEIDTEFTENVRIVQITDLHNRVFGDDNTKLVEKIIDSKPDFVVMTGDMINENEESLSVITSLVKKLTISIPVYFSLGNHELVYLQNYDDSLFVKLENAGATVLNYEYQDINVNGNNIRIGGYYGYYRTPHLDTNDIEQQNYMNQFSNSFEDTDNYKILLCHIPTPWLDWHRIDDFPVDLVLCGHYHGGQIRIPFIGGLYAPYVGWFPKYTKGLFIGEQSNCVLSTGLGAEGFIPRFNNPPEIVVIDLKKY